MQADLIAGLFKIVWMVCIAVAVLTAPSALRLVDEDDCGRLGARLFLEVAIGNRWHLLGGHKEALQNHDAEKRGDPVPD